MRPGKPAIWLALVLACFSPFCVTTAFGQMLAPTQSSNFAQQGFDVINDVFIGRGSCGPYMLSWKNIESGTDNVLISGRKLVRGQEYTIDYAAGMLAFQEAVPQNRMVRVSYNKIAAKAVQNGGSVSMPLTAKLLGDDRGSLNVLGFYRGSDAKAANSGLTVFGLSGDRKLGTTSGLSTMLLFSQGDDSKDSAANAGFLDNAALKLGSDTTLGRFALRGSILRVGQNFAGSKEYGLQQGKQQLDLGGTYGNESDIVFASFSYKQQDSLGADSAASQTSIEQKVVLNLENMPTLAYSHVGTDAASTGTTTDTIKLDQKFGSKTTAMASFQKSETGKDGHTTKVDTTQLAFQSSALQNMQLRAGMLMTESDQSGGATGLDFGVQLTPGKRLTVDAAYQINNSDAGGQQDRTLLRVAMNPLDQVQLQSTLSWNGSDKGDETGVDVSMKAKLGAIASIEGTYGGKQTDIGQDEERHMVRLNAKPAEFVTVSAGLAQNITGTAQQNNVDAKIELATTDKFRLATGYAESTNGTAITTTRDYSGSLKPASFMELAGIYKNRDVTGSDAPDTTSVNMSLGTAKAFRVTGKYSTNPEDTKGTVLRVTSRAVGLDVKLGIVGIIGGYTENDEYMADRLTRETLLGINMPVFGHGSLTTSYKVAQAIAAAEQSAVTYSLGYTHIIGSSFNLSLAGELTQFDQSAMSTKDEYKATAKLGMSF